MGASTGEHFNWGIPDWRSPRDYGRTEDWSDLRWRWEFTRRRDDYRRDFERALNSLSDDEYFKFTVTLEVAEPFEDLPGGQCLRFEHPWARTYSLIKFYDPVVSDWTCYGPEFDPGWSSGLQSGPSELEVFLPAPYQYFVSASEPQPHLVPMTFDLTRPLAPQLEQAKRVFETAFRHYISKHAKSDASKLGGRATKHHRTNWHRYLRLLDAEAAGASLSLMSEVILSQTHTRADPQTAANMLNQARALRF